MESSQEMNIVITLIVGILVMLILATVVILFVIKYQKNILIQNENLRNAEKKYQNDLLDATIIVSERERESVAKNIHDDIGTLTNIIKLNNRRLKNNAANESIVKEIINTNDQLLLEINESIRAISNDLASPTLSKLGFIRAFEQLCVQISYANFVKVEFDFGEVEMRFDRKVEVQLFRVCKEVLNNIIKHSGSTEIDLKLIFDKGILTILVKHNGTGVNDNEVKLIMENNKGLGLKSTYSRIQILQGIINYFTPKEERACVLIKIPIKPKLNA